MDDENKRTLVNQINRELAGLEKETERLKASIQPIPPDNAIGRLTRMEAINAKNMSEANLRKAKTRMAHLKKALGQIDDPDFGICLGCHREIPPARLMLVPNATRCVFCLNRSSFR